MAGTIKKNVLKNLVISGIGSLPIHPHQFCMGFKNGEMLSYNLIYCETMTESSHVKPNGFNDLLSKHAKKLGDSQYILGFGTADGSKGWARYEIHLVDEGTTYRVKQINKLSKGEIA